MADSTDDKKDQIKKHYIPRLEQYNENHNRLDWESVEAHEERFRILMEELLLLFPGGKFSLLDVGCGLGDLLGFLQKNQIKCDYTGVDILAEMINEARKQYSRADFFQMDIFRDNQLPRKEYDAVYTSGMFNLDLGNNWEFFRSSFPVMLSLTRKLLAFNLLSSESDEKEERYFYFNKNDITGFLQSFADKKRDFSFSVKEDYLHNDFTVFCYRKSAKAEIE